MGPTSHNWSGPLYFWVVCPPFGFRCLDLAACTFAVAAWLICDLLTHSHDICPIYCLPLCAGCDSMMLFLEYVGSGLNEGGLELLFVGFKS